MPDVLPTINNEPPQGIQALLDTVYLWNPDVANDLIEKVNELLEKLDGLSGKIPPYAELEAPVAQYTPCYEGDNVYVAAQDIDALPAELDPLQWILIATKAPVLTAGDGIEIEGNEISVTQAISEGASAGATAVQPEDLGTAAYAATTDFATAAQGTKADTALQPGSAVPQYSTMPAASASLEGQIVQYSGLPASGFTTAYFYKCVSTPSSATATSSNPEVSVSVDVSVFETQVSASGQYVFEYDVSLDAWLDSDDNPVVLADYGITKEGVSINMDKIFVDYTAGSYGWEQTDVQEQPSIGRFLALWNCATGLAETNPPANPYEYRAGDYFVVGTVDSTTNYRPAGTSYVIGTASSTVETSEVAVGDSYFFDGTNWRLQSNSSKTVTFANVAGDVYDNSSAATALNAKQDTLVSGTNIKTINNQSLLGGGNINIESGVPQYSTMPTASASNVGEIVQYSGTTTGSYTNGYFYESTPIHTDPSATISQTVGSSLTNLSIDVDLFVAKEQPSGNMGVNFIYAAVTEALNPTTFTYSTMSLSVEPATFLEKLHEMYTGDYSILKRITLGFNGTFWTVAGWAADGGNMFIWDDITPSGIDIAWGVTVTGTEVVTSPNEFSMAYTANSNTWTKAGVPVNIAEYGVTYSGTPVIDDVLYVVYTAPTVSGYAWTQKNVQPAPETPSAGIDWKAIVDLPDTWPGDLYRAFPYYTVAGGLPDGEYEFYFSTKQTTDNTDVPLGEVIFKVILKIDNTNSTVYGKMGYVFNGDYMNDANTIIGSTSVSLWNMFHKNDSDIVIFSTEIPFASDVLGYNNKQTVPGCFKMSAIKNVETGEEYIPVGAVRTEGDGWPAYTSTYSGTVVLRELVTPPYIPGHYVRNSFTVTDSDITYLYANGITQEGSGWNYANQMNLSLSFDGDVFNATLRTMTNFDYELIVTDATGVLENVQIGFADAGHQPYIKLNLPANTSGTLFAVLGLCGTIASSDAYLGVVPTQPNSFTPLNVLKVGETPVNPLYLGRVMQYTGATNATYTNGYFYKVTGTVVTTPQSYVPYNITPSGCTVTIDIDNLIPALMSWIGWSVDTLMYYLREPFEWYIYCVDNTIQSISWSAYGQFTDSSVLDCFTVTNPNSTESITFYATYTPETKTISGGAWTRIDVQPSGGGSSLPDQTNKEGMFLQTNGSTAQWSDTRLTHSTTKTFTYDENTMENVLRITPKQNRDCWVRIECWEGLDDGEGGLMKGQQLFASDLYLSHADLLRQDGNFSSKALITNLYIGNYIIFGPCVQAFYDEGGQTVGGFFDIDTFYTYEEEIPTGEERYVIMDIKYSDGVDTFTYPETFEGAPFVYSTGMLLPSPIGLKSEFGDVNCIPMAEYGGQDVIWQRYPFANVYGNVWNDYKTVVCENGTYVEKYYSQAAEMPQLTSETGYGYIYNHALFQYTGDTDATFTHGYFYEVYYVLDRNATASQTTGSGLTDFAIDQAVFAQGIWDYNQDIGQDTVQFEYYNSVWNAQFTTADLATVFGITFTGTPMELDVIEVAFDEATWDWRRVDVQPQPVIPDPLPSQTGNAGKFLTTNGTAASWGDALINTNTAYYGLSVGFGPTNVAGATTVGKGASNSSAYSVCIGGQARVGSNSSLGIAIGNAATIGDNANYAIQIGVGTNSDANTFKVGNNNGNFEIMNANGMIPTARLTKVNSIITLTSAGWSSNTQTVNVTGMTTTGVVLVSPTPANQADYTSAGIICSAQGSGTLTFTCDTAPSGDIDVVVIML